jgi:uroporphyrin-III C-methyltransferase
MGVKHLPFICNQLHSCGKDSHTPIAVIEQGTTGNQRTVIGTLETIVEVVNENQITNPAMIVIGEVVKLAEKLSWIPESIIEEILI